MKMFIPITKVDVARREVYGVMAEETPDKSGEVFDYASSKPLIQKWSEQFDKATGGKSLGNVRIQHGNAVAGKIVGIEFDDANKCIPVVAKVVDDNAWKMVEEGVFTGFSIGGKYRKRWTDGQYTRYTADPSEVSLVDNPCMYGALFTAVKADGQQEMRKFAGSPKPKTVVVDGAKYELAKDARTKRVAGKDLTSSDFAYVGDPEKTATWKLPIMDAAHVRNALARFNQTQGIPGGEKPKVLARIKAKAREFGIDVSSDDAGKLAKSMYSVASLSETICSLDYVAESLEYEADYEGDNSPVPGKLNAIIEQLCEILVALAEEETSELTAEKLNKENEMTDQEKEKLAGLEKQVADLTEKLAKAAEPAKPAAAAPARSEEVIALEKQVAELAERTKAINEGLQKLLATPEKPKAAANGNGGTVLSKDADNGAAGAVTEAELAKMSPEDQIKHIYRGGGSPEIPFRPMA